MRRWIQEQPSGAAPSGDSTGTLEAVTDTLEEIRARLHEAAAGLRSGEAELGVTLALIEECARLAGDAASVVDTHVRAALEPLPDLPGQLPLPAA